MKYYIISAAINLGILLIPIATPVLKQKLEEKKEKQTIVVDLKNSILEENKTKSTVDTDSNEENNGTSGLQKGNLPNKNNAISEAQSIEPSKQPKNPKQPELSQAQPIQPQQTSPQSPKVAQETIPKEQPKPTSRPIIPPVASTPKTSTQPVISQSTGNPAISKPVQNTITASNSAISNNSGHKNTPSSSGTSHRNKSGNTANGSSTGSKNGNGTSGNSTSSGNGNDKKSGSTRGGGCRRGVDFSVSYNSHLEVPTANQRLKRKETIVATIRFTRGGSVSIQSVTGGNSQSQAAARRAASNVHVSFLTDNCSSGIVTLQFNIN